MIDKKTIRYPGSHGRKARENLLRVRRGKDVGRTWETANSLINENSLIPCQGLNSRSLSIDRLAATTLKTFRFWLQHRWNRTTTNRQQKADFGTFRLWDSHKKTWEKNISGTQPKAIVLALLLP